jgi:hypothetical protein
MYLYTYVEQIMWKFLFMKQNLCFLEENDQQEASLYNEKN